MKAHGAVSRATKFLQNARRTLVVKLAIICFVLMLLYGVAYKYSGMTITHRFLPLNLQGYETEHGKVDVYRVLTTDTSGKRVAVLLNVTRDESKFTNKSVADLPYFYKSIKVPDSIPNGFNTNIVETSRSDQKENKTDFYNLTHQAEVDIKHFNKTIDVPDSIPNGFNTIIIESSHAHQNEPKTDVNNSTHKSEVELKIVNKNIYVADSIPNGFNTGMVKTTQATQNEKQTGAITQVSPTDRSVPKAERLVAMPMVYISQTRKNLTSMFKTTQAPKNEKQADAITQVISTDLNVPKAERLVSMTDISQIKLPGTLTSLQPLGPGVKESREFPGMPDPCTRPNRMTGVEDILCMKPPKFLPEYKNPCWQDGHMFRCLPYFHLIGMCKSATSDLFKRLHVHPDIIPNRGTFGKEIWYWSWRRLEITGRFRRFKMGMTLKEFTNQFFTSKLQTRDVNGIHNKITGHGDPMDFWDRFRDSNTPQNTPGAEELLWTTPYAIRHVNPNVKLLLMLRDPVDRLYSHYFHGAYGTSAQSFHEHVVTAIERWNACTSSHSIRHCIYDQPFGKTLPAPIYTSFYLVHLLEWLKVFPREQILIFRNEDYTVDIRTTLIDIFRFLDVDIPSDRILTQMTNIAPFYETKKRKSAGPMLPETKRLLVELYRPYNEQLATFLGDDRFAWRDQ